MKITKERLNAANDYARKNIPPKEEALAFMESPLVIRQIQAVYTMMVEEELPLNKAFLYLLSTGFFIGLAFRDIPEPGGTVQ